MKILFTADIHIKLGQKNVPVPWTLNRYELLMDKLWTIQDQADLFIVGGDIFDKLPSMEELEVYFDFVASCKIPTYIYSGNHEAVKKNTTFLTSLKTVTLKINNLVQVVDDYWSHPTLPIDIIPYNKLKDYEKHTTEAFSSLHNRILCTHVRGDIPPHVKAEVDLDIFSNWKVVLAGDLHSYSNSQRNIVYPGSPISTSFHRNPIETGVVVLDTETLKHSWIVLNLPQLIRKTVKAGEQMVPGDFDHVVYEVEGNLSELINVEDSDLVDKKLVKKTNDLALILDSTMTITQEVQEYLLYVLGLDEKMCLEVIEEFKSYESRW